MRPSARAGANAIGGRPKRDPAGQAGSSSSSSDRGLWRPALTSSVVQRGVGVSCTSQNGADEGSRHRDARKGSMSKQVRGKRRAANGSRRENGTPPPLPRRAGAAFLLESSLRTMRKTNVWYLKRRRREKWWKRQEYPFVPSDAIQTKKLGRVMSSATDPKGMSASREAFRLLRKMLPLGALFFCASFNLTLLQNTKDALVVVSGGAEQLPFLASYCVLPLSLLFFFYYNKLLSALEPQQVFYAAMAPLLGFYALFAFVLYPSAESLHLNALRGVLTQALPTGFHGLVSIVCNWTYSLFFCFAEVWGTIVISVLFWTIANDVCSIKEAKTVYPLLGISANVALVAGGAYLKAINGSFGGANAFGTALQVLLTTVLVVSVAMMAVKGAIDRAKAREDAKALLREDGAGSSVGSGGEWGEWGEWGRSQGQGAQGEDDLQGLVAPDCWNGEDPVSRNAGGGLCGQPPPVRSVVEGPAQGALPDRPRVPDRAC